MLRLLLLFALTLSGTIWPSAARSLQHPATSQPVTPTHVVTTADGPDGLARALSRAQEGDTIEVRGGHYVGPIVVDRRVSLVGRDWPVVDGGGEDTVLKLSAPDIYLSGFVIRDSGDSLDEENAGIAVEAANARIVGNRLEGTLFGIYLREAPGSIIRGNEIHSIDLPVPRRGDAIRVWYSNDVTIEANVIDKGRDVVLWYSERLAVRGNTVTNGRYGLHFMYCDDALIEGNRLMNNSVGAFLMYSRRIMLQNNTIAGNRGPSGYGVGLKDMDDAVVASNLFLDNRVGAYLDNSPREVDSVGHFESNLFAYNDIGVSFLPSVRHNIFSGNSFVDNQQQVAIAGGGLLRDNVWTVEGRGNYWSDYAGYDLDGDGVGEEPYKSERLFESMMDHAPLLRLFLYSPAADAVDFAARAFPLVKPQPRLSDEGPLMAPVMVDEAPALPRPADEGAWLWLASGLLAGSFLLVGLGGRQQAARSRQQAARRIAACRRPPAACQEEETMIRVTNLTKRFGKLTAVDGLSFNVQQGEAVALWGANGAGKTTVLRCLLNLIPYEGRIQVGGVDARRQSKAVRRLVGFVPQELTLHDEMSVRETLLFYAALKKIPDNYDFAPLLARLALQNHLDKPVRDLSGGLKQRLALAIALLSDPPLLLLDEPTSNLDIQAREDFLDLLVRLKEAGKTLVFSSHRLEEMLVLADRVLVLSDGSLVADCPPARLREELGWETTLHLMMDADGIDRALRLLGQQGLRAQRNGRGVLVRVPANQKGKAMQTLYQAGIEVKDFTLE